MESKIFLRSFILGSILINYLAGWLMSLGYTNSLISDFFYKKSVFSLRFSDYESYSPETWPYYTASLILIIPFSLIYAITAYIKIKGRNQIKKSDLVTNIVILLVASITSVYAVYFMPITSSSGNLLTYSAAFIFPIFPILAAFVPIVLGALVGLVMSTMSKGT